MNRIFKEYYKSKNAEIPLVNLFNQREFGFIPWDIKTRMNRHMGFRNRENLLRYLVNIGPRHAYSSGALYLQPENQDMEKKDYKGCDLIVDIDVDHFYTPCKENHDFWYCKECGKRGKGMIEKCPNCKKAKIKSLTWICEQCLNTAKNEILKLIFQFLIPDFGIDLNQIKIAFSGHRGYHLKIEDEKIRTLSSDERREIADYISGENITFDFLGLREKGGNIFGFLKQNIGWSQKIFRKLEEILSQPDAELEKLLIEDRNFQLNKNVAKSFIRFKKEFQNTLINETRNIWAIEGFGLQSWIKILTGIANKVGVEIDTPVTIDIHRLIRYPGSLHGKTGFRVQELNPDTLEKFNPLDEMNEMLDPIVFESKVQTTQKLEIVESELPATKIKGETFGPYSKGEIIEVPHHFAVFLLCKEVAKTI
ncbi:MAG: DNA primase small subunit domain-containing protein [Candidatus Thorarchaeota archaeon]